MLGVAIEAFLLSLIGAVPDAQAITDAQAIIRGYRDNENAVTSWKGLDRKVWCDRIIELLGDPKRLDQGHSNYCMAAACLIVLFKRVPETMADFCRDLARNGKGKINELEITMTKKIQNYDIPTYAAKKTVNVNLVDFILLLAIESAMSTFNIESPDENEDSSAAPSTSASHIKNVLEETKLFKIEEINPPKPSTLKDQTADSDIILVGKVSFFTSSARFQKHAVVLVPPFEVNGNVKFNYWSWGMVESEMTPGVQLHHNDSGAGDYYVRTCSPGEFNLAISTAYVATLK